MEIDNGSMDEKTKRMRDLLSSFYSPDASTSGSSMGSSNRYASPLEAINTTSFNPDQYMSILVCLKLLFLFSSFRIFFLFILIYYVLCIEYMNIYFLFFGRGGGWGGME